MILSKRGSAIIVAIAMSITLNAAAWAQTADHPMRSRLQIVAGSGAGETFVVDAGATRVAVDVRQLSADDTCEVTGPSGLPVDMNKAVQRPAEHQDLRNSGDPLGNFEDLVIWDSPDPGEHTLAGSGDFVGLVQIDGGAELGFWFEGLKDGATSPGQPITLSATLQDGLGLPLAGASVTASITRVATAAGVEIKPSKFPMVQTVTLEPEKPGTYSATLESGVARDGVYHVSVLAEQDLSRRQVATSFAVWSGPLPPARAPGASPPPISIVAPGKGENDTIEPIGGGGSADEMSAETASVDGGIVALPPSDDGKPVASVDKVSAYPGQIFVGGEFGADPLKPVIVFLHGWNSDTAIWDRPNGGFYHAAIEANYRVASIGLHPDKDFMTNAAILSEALPAVAHYFDVRKMVIVAHSKGGVDMDAIAMLGNGTDYATTIMTLSSPHYGSPLADVVDQLPDWLIGGFKNEAQESLRVANMAMFRASVANNPNNGRVDIRTFGGWGYSNLDWNSDIIEYAYAEITGPILKYLAGDNDGIVPYISTVRPSSTTIFHGKPDSRTNVNHSQIRERVHYWAHIQAQLLTSSWDNSPSPPANVTAELTDVAGDTANVTMIFENNSPRANVLHVYRSIDGQPFVEIADPPVISYPVYVDVGVGIGHTYAYHLRYGIYDQWTSDDSNTVSVTFASPIPSAPTHLAATVQSPSSIKLTWTDTSSNETGFELYRRLASGGGYALVGTVVANTTQKTDNNLAANTAYSYKVRAINGTYVSPDSNVVTATTSPLPLNPPSNLAAAYNAATNRITLTWTDNAGVEDGFALQFSFGGGAWSDLSPATVAANVTTYATTPPTTGNYQFRVRAFRGSETTTWSNSASVTVAPAQPLTAPSNLSGVFNATTTRITLNWADNSTNEDGFVLQVAPVGGSWVDLSPATVVANVTTYLTAPFANVGNYQFRVRAFRGSDVSPWSNVAQVSAIPPTPLNAPSGLTGSYSSTTNRVSLAWNDNSANEDGFALQMAYGTGAWTDLAPATVGANATSYVTGTFPSQYGDYRFRVRAFRGGESSAWSNAVTVGVYPSATAMTPPSNLVGSYSPNTNRVTLTWRDNSSNEDGFGLQMAYGGSDLWADLYPATVGPNTVSYTTGAFPQMYGYFDFRVRAVRGAELTPWSNIAVVGVFPGF